MISQLITLFPVTSSDISTYYFVPSNFERGLTVLSCVVSRMANARNKSELADRASDKAKQDSDIARLKAKEYAPEFHQPGKTDIWIDGHLTDVSTYVHTCMLSWLERRPMTPEECPSFPPPIDVTYPRQWVLPGLLKPQRLTTSRDILLKLATSDTSTITYHPWFMTMSTYFTNQMKHLYSITLTNICLEKFF